MADNTPYYRLVPPRAEVVRLYTGGYVAYYDALVSPPPDGLGGEVDDTATYTIRDAAVDPPPAVALNFGYVTDAQGDETLVCQDVVQAVYRDGGVLVRDAAAHTVGTVYTYCVLLYAEVRNPDGTPAAVFRWSDDPDFDLTQQPPYDADAATTGFAADYTRWTAIPL